MTVETSDDLATSILAHLATRDTTDLFDCETHVATILKGFGAPTDGYGSLSFYGADPIVPSVLRFGTMAAVGLAVKSAMIATIWRERTGEEQAIEVDLRKALRRFTPFMDRKWELVNGYDGGRHSDPDNPLVSDLYETRDHRWVMPVNPYPRIHSEALRMLGVPNTREAVAEAFASRDGAELEQAGVEAGIVLALARPVQDILRMPVYTQGLEDRPLVSIVKVADSEPVPFTRGAQTPLDGIRALGLAHVIAAPAIGRALALHGADVLNVWNPQDWEHGVFYNSSHVGMRSSTLDLADHDAMSTFTSLLRGADVFFSNRRPGYLQRHGLSAETLGETCPGLVHTSVVFANEQGPWSDRVGFDTAAGAAMGVHCLEGSDEKPVAPPIHVVNDYVCGWLATAGTLEALRRRASEGGSYKVVVSLSRVVLWLMSLGIFDKAYATAVADSTPEHLYVPPDQFTAETPLGAYTGVTEQVRMSKTPGFYRHVLVPRGSSRPEWL